MENNSTNLLQVSQYFVVIIATIAIVGETTEEVPGYDLIFPGLWLLVVIGFALSVCLPRFTVSHAQARLKSQLTFALSLLALLLILSLISFYRLELTKNTGAYILLASTLSAAVIALGWHIGAVFSFRSNRIQHTMNVLVNSRLSTEFRQNLRNLCKVYPGSARIDLTDAETELNRLITDDSGDMDKHTAKYLAVQGAEYVLNFYEFLSGAIRSGDCEEDLVYQTVGSYVLSLPRKLWAVIEVLQRDQPSAFEHLQHISRRWAHRYALEWEEELARRHAPTGRP